MAIFPWTSDFAFSDFLPYTVGRLFETNFRATARQPSQRAFGVNLVTVDSACEAAVWSSRKFFLALFRIPATDVDTYVRTVRKYVADVDVLINIGPEKLGPGCLLADEVGEGKKSKIKIGRPPRRGRWPPEGYVRLRPCFYSQIATALLAFGQF